MRSAGVAHLLHELLCKTSVVGAGRWDERAPITDRVAAPVAQMPSFIKGLHQAFSSGVAAGHFELPDLARRGPLHVFTDFTGRLDAWTASAFLCVAEADLRATLAHIATLRRDLRAEDGRRFEYKSLHDPRRRNGLPRWLDAFDRVRGLAFVLLVRRDVHSAFQLNREGEPGNVVATVRELGFGDWARTSSGDRLLEEALRVIHTIGYLHAVLAGSGSKLRWISDNDEILDGPVRRESVATLLPLVAEKYSGGKVAASVTTEAELADSPRRDFLSIPDLLAAGVLEHQRGTESGASDIIAKAGAIGSWLRDVDVLQKLVLQVTPGSDEGLEWRLYRPYFEAAGETR